MRSSTHLVFLIMHSEGMEPTHNSCTSIVYSVGFVVSILL